MKMDEMNDLIHEDPIEEVPVEEVIPDVEKGTEQVLVETPIEQEPSPSSDLVTPTMSTSKVVGTDDASTDAYNQGGKEEENEWGSCDCRSECRYNTGHTYKYADYGYSG